MTIQLVFKKGQNYTVNPSHEIDGFLISYYAISYNDVPLEKTNVKSFLKRIKRVADELSIKKVTFFIDFIYDVGGAACCVDEQNIVHLTLPITVKDNKILIEKRKGYAVLLKWWRMRSHSVIRTLVKDPQSSF